MDILIPTLGRAHRQITFQNLPQKIREHVYLVVQLEDYKKHKLAYDHITDRIIVLPPHINTIAQTRAWIMDTPAFSDTVIMLDDDLVFSARREDEPTKFRSMEKEDYGAMFYDLSELIERYPMGGVSHREGANRNTEEILPFGRSMRVLGFNRPMIKELGIEFGRIELMEDFDVTLQLLRKGFPNPILNMWVHNQGGSDTSGGCSTFRTPELQAECANKLAELHPGFVKVVEKSTKTSWGGGTRTDVTVYWKRAFQSGQH